MYIQYSVWEVSPSLPSTTHCRYWSNSTHPLNFFLIVQLLIFLGDIVSMKHRINPKLKVMSERYFFMKKKLWCNFTYSSEISLSQIPTIWKRPPKKYLLGRIPNPSTSYCYFQLGDKIQQNLLRDEALRSIGNTKECNLEVNSEGLGR